AELSGVDTRKLFNWIQLSIQAFYTRHDGLKYRPGHSLNHATPPSAAERIACPDCGLVQLLPPPVQGHKPECARCSRMLASRATGRVAAPLALVSAALMFLVPATISPLMIVSTYGADRESWLPGSASALWDDGFPSLGALVAVFAIGLPFLYLIMLIWVLGSLQFGGDRRVGALFRLTPHLRPWAL